MKLKTLTRSLALVAVGLFLGHSARAYTVLDFDSMPNGVGINDVISQDFGDVAASSSDGVTVVGFGTPNIGLTWQSTGGTWDHYTESGGGAVWTAIQLDSSDVGDRHEVIFAPNNPAVAAVIKSLNFHGYYTSNERFTYDVSILSGTTVLSGPTNITFLSDSTKNHPVSLNYTGVVGQILTLRIVRAASTLGGGEVEGDPYDIAVDDIAFAQLPETTFLAGPQVTSVEPADQQFAPPDRFYLATLTDGLTGLKVPSVRLRLNGTLVSATVNGSGGTSTVSYQAAGLLAPGSTNTYRLTYDDNDTPSNSYTNEVKFVVVDYINKQLPAPLFSENFNTTAEGALPTGWTRTNLNTLADPTSEPAINFVNLDSAAYTNWTVVEAYRFTNLFQTYSQEYNGSSTPPGEAADYQRVLSLNPSNVVNGAFVRSFASGRFLFGNAGYRLDVLGQVMYAFSPDYNLTGRSNIHLSFHNLWEQNQDSIAAIEYSIDMGTNWLPALYLLVGSDIATNLDGSIDSLATFSTQHSDVAQYIDPVSLLQVGGYYGAFIGVASNQWSSLAPFISARADDDPVGSKRVEIIRLPQADNQPKVRLRFAHAGADSWYFGVDDLGLYSLPSLKITSFARSGTNAIITWPAELNTKLQRAPSLTAPNWEDVPGSLGAAAATNAITGSSAFYRLARPY